MAITFVSVGSGGDNNNASSVTPGAPGSLSSGDILLCVAVYASASETITMTGDWSKVGQANATNCSTGVWWHRYTGSLPSLVVSSTNTGTWAAVITAFRGCKASGSPINTSSSNSGDSGTITHLTITPSVDGCLGVCLNGSRDDSSRTETSGWDRRGYASGTASAPDRAVHVQTKTLTTSATGSVDVSQSPSTQWGAWLLAMEPEPEGASGGAWPHHLDSGSMSGGMQALGFARLAHRWPHWRTTRRASGLLLAQAG